MIGAALTKEKVLNLYARIAEASIPVLLTFLNEDGSPHAITSYNFQLWVKRVSGATTKIFTLTIGDGLTIVGAGLNQLQIVVSAERATGRRAETNFYQLYASYEDHTWLNGPFVWHDGSFDGLQCQCSSTICTEDMVTITIESGGAVTSVQYFRGTLEQSSPEEFPTSDGSGTGGAIQAGDNWIYPEGGTWNGIPYDVARLTALADGASTLGNFKID